MCLLATQVYHAWNQLRALDMPVSSWPGIMAAVVSDLLAENPIRGRLMLGAALWAMQVGAAGALAASGRLYSSHRSLRLNCASLALLTTACAANVMTAKTGPLQLQWA